MTSMASSMLVVCCYGVPQVHIVAHGLGGLAALRFVERAPAVVRSIALVSPYASLADLRPASAPPSVGPARPRGTAAVLLPTVSTNAQACASLGRHGERAVRSRSLPRASSSAASGRERLRATSAPVLLAYGGGGGEIVDVSWRELPASVTRRAYEPSRHLPTSSATIFCMSTPTSWIRPTACRPTASSSAPPDAKPDLHDPTEL